MRACTVMYVIGGLNAGGAERQLLTLVQGLDKTLWNPVVCSMRSGTLFEEFTAAAPVHLLGKSRVVDLRALARLVGLVRHYRPAVIHTYMSTGNTWGRLAALIAFAVRPEALPVIVASERSIDTWKSSLHRGIDRALLGATDAMSCNSIAVARYLTECDRVPRARVATIPNGIDLRRVQRLLGCPAEERVARRAALGFRPDDFVIGHIGRSSAVKGLDLLVDVFDRVRREVPSVRLLRLAQPPLPDEVAPAQAFVRQLQERGLTGAVVMHPYTTEITAVLVTLDALVQTSLSEGLPNVVMEAMAMEVPVVVTAAGGTVELVRHRQTGWIVPVGDREGLIAGLRYVRSHPEQAGLWARAARQVIERQYTHEAMVARTVALYGRLLVRRGGG